MKIIKKVLLVSVMFISVIVLSGCGNKKPITAEEFKTKMEGKSFILTDVTSQFSSDDYIDKAYVAQNNSREYQIEFLEISTEKDAISVYDNNKNIFESSLGNVVKGKFILNSKNEQKFRATSNGYSMFLTRKGNTIIYARVPAKYSKTVSNFIKDLGY